MADTLKKVEVLARDLNPSFEIDQRWLEKVMQLEKQTREHFLKQAVKVLQAESERSYFDSDHYKKTLSEKKILSQPLSLLLTELVADIFPPCMDLTGHSKYLGQFSESDVEDAANSIREYGYYIWPELLDTSSIENLTKELLYSDYENRMTGKVVKGTYIADNLLTPDNSMHGVWWVRNAKNLVKHQNLQDISLDPGILAIAQESLKATPIHVQTNCWWTFPPIQKKHNNAKKYGKRAESKNAQRFHQDQEFITFLKVFIYLSEVGENNGPHVYVENSAGDSGGRLNMVLSSDRHDDKDIENAFGKERIKSITGPKGQIAFVNTRGFHKGAPVLEGHRLILQLEYASSLYFNPVESFEIDSLSAKNYELYEQAPRVLVNYRPVSTAKQLSMTNFLAYIKRKISHIRGRVEERTS
jgi:hypothetical protein